MGGYGTPVVPNKYSATAEEALGILQILKDLPLSLKISDSRFKGEEGKELAREVSDAIMSLYTTYPGLKSNIEQAKLYLIDPRSKSWDPGASAYYSPYTREVVLQRHEDIPNSLAHEYVHDKQQNDKLLSKLIKLLAVRPHHLPGDEQMAYRISKPLAQGELDLSNDLSNALLKAMLKKNIISEPGRRYQNDLKVLGSRNPYATQTLTDMLNAVFNLSGKEAENKFYDIMYSTPDVP